ncbi:PadR family transcriptional regulator [Microcoleus sp. FACHB-1515]|uniref:PadR family transcriptional regulator n=1 Tax=Cyanophyceae TaxID=3028117 RepID=UPI001688BE32|nr:PadR family transcriptional regulator [Microcoleus sp. FACHB-1515]MBD2089814.1 PadR family transcriptional regulator [Microcoleus sp. FACHB-1515]
MSLPHIILALLEQQEQTGYDLKTSCFDRSIAPLWTADQAHIYRTLDRLIEQNCIDCTIEIQHNRPNRKIYKITPAGQAELHNWLKQPQSLPIVREPFLMQLFLGAQLANETLLELLNHQKSAHVDRLADCQAAAAALNSVSSREQVLQQLVLNLLQKREQLYLDWLEEAIATVNSLELTQTP